MGIKNHLNKITLAAILLVAAVLRFYRFTDLPFMWDELSALNRLHFSSFAELIEKGVKPDGHPAGVQVFLYYWTAMFGNSEWIVKLPFNLMGLASILVFYQISRIWFSKKAGLLASSFMATLQFFVLYSPIARPYVSGLFLSLMMVYFWSQYFFKKPHKKQLLGFVIFAALSAYNHHFSLLFAAIVGLTGLFLIKKQQTKEYIFSGILIFVLYIPHLPVFFNQLSIGGIGGEGNWLAAPSSHFFIDFFEWSFQYSYATMGLVISLLLLSLFFHQVKDRQKWVKNSILITWVILPILIAYFYSTQVNPVIQFSLFIFSFPYFILLFSSWAEKMKYSTLIPLIVVLMSFNSYQLIKERQHYKIIFNQPFEVAAQTAKKLQDLSSSSVFTIYNTIPSYQNYHFNKYQLPIENSYSIYDKEPKLIEIDALLKTLAQDHIVCCGLQSEMIPLIQYHFPYLVKRIDAYTMEIYVFSKKNPTNALKLSKSIDRSFTNSEEGWNINPVKCKNDSSGIPFYNFEKQDEWGCNFGDSLEHLNIERGSTIDLIADIYSLSDTMDVLWVGTFEVLNKEQIWRGGPMELIPTDTNNHYRVFFSLDTQILINSEDWDQQYFKTYIWNKGGHAFRIYDINIHTRAVNPLKYGFFQKLP